MTGSGRVVVAEANLRDLGGIPLGDGAAVGEGRLYRSAYLGDLGAAGQSTVAGLGLRTIVDLRRPNERALKPQPSVPYAHDIHLSVSDDDNEFAVMAAQLADGADPSITIDQAIAYYRNLVHRQLPRFRPVFAMAADPRRWPLLFHCAAGKDRTGFVAASLLGLAGADDDTIMADYLHSNEVRAPFLEGRIANYLAGVTTQRGITVDQLDEREVRGLRSMFICEPACLQAVLDAVAERFGSWDHFATDGLGLSPASLATYREAICT